MSRSRPLCLALVLAAAACSAAGNNDFSATGGSSGADASLDVSMEAGSDVTIDVSSSGDALFDIPLDAPSNMCPGFVQSFIWIANTAEGTLSKVCTVNGVEVARYFTSPQGYSGDPSRTSVNLHGDAVVTNRDPQPGPSSVTKFAADVLECIDRNHNGMIDTSMGPQDVKPWGEDECMLWNTPLTNSASNGARATAWDGQEDAKTGKGGRVFIGALTNKTIYRINGDTGQLEAQAATALGHYGGAIDNKGNLWTVAMTCTIGLCSIERISLDDLSSHEVFPVHCGYGISIDAKGRVWTAGMGCVSRFDPETKENKWVQTGAQGFNRGVAVGAQLSAGFVWAAETSGSLLKIDPEAMVEVERQNVGTGEMVGVAIDHEGYVWTVSQGANAAYKIHPNTWEVVKVPIGSGPYTYSDMTGMQLRGVKEGPK